MLHLGLHQWLIKHCGGHVAATVAGGSGGAAGAALIGFVVSLLLVAAHEGVQATRRAGDASRVAKQVDPLVTARIEAVESALANLDTADFNEQLRELTMFMNSCFLRAPP